MAMATRLLLRLRYFSRPLPPAHIPDSSSSGAQLGNGVRHHLARVLHCSPPDVRRHLHVLPRAVANNTRCFGGGSRWHSSSSKPPRPRHILTNVLSVAALAALLLDNTSSDDNQKSPPTGQRDHGSNKEKREWTDTLLTVNLLVYSVDVATKGTLSLWGARENDLVRKGQIWRMVTSCFLHAGPIHLAANSLTLHDIGAMVEEITGPRKFLTIYFTSALSGSLLSYCVRFGPSVGSSSAICGLIGAQAVYMWRHREHLEKANETLQEIAFDVLLNAGVGIALRHRINNWGHLGGLLGGAALEWFIGPDWSSHQMSVAEDGAMVFQDRAPLAKLINGTIGPQ